MQFLSFFKNYSSYENEIQIQAKNFAHQFENYLKLCTTFKMQLKY